MKKVLLLIIPLFSLLAACGEEVKKPTVKYERVGGQGKMHFVYMKKSSEVSRDSYLQVGDYICKGENVCIVMFWDNKSLVPSSIPMTDKQVDSKVAHYNLNKNTGMQRMAMCATDGC